MISQLSFYRTAGIVLNYRRSALPEVPVLPFKPAVAALIFCAFVSAWLSAQQLTEVNRTASTHSETLQAAAPSANEEDADADSQPASVFPTTVRNLFNEDKFAQLEAIANDVRSQESRFLGGAWKLHTFYGAVRTPGSLTATDAAWNAHIERLQRWIAFAPDSSTPRVALAESYLRFAWKARGSGSGDKVTADGWKLFGERVQKARDTLDQAKSISTKDPQWYETMLVVSLAQGWDQERAEQLLAEASAVAPNYYYFYDTYANYLLPKWYGKPGDSETFAQTIADRIGGLEGDAVYFRLALSLNCCKARAQAPAIAWDRVKQGFTSLHQLYGVTNYQRNALAFMAVRQQDDRELAQQLFARLGDNWSEKVWRSKDQFESSKASLSQSQ
jgi:hypothetical protein